MLEFPYRPIYWQALLFIYRIGLHQVMPLGVVFLFVLVNWCVEKHQHFFIQSINQSTFVKRHKSRANRINVYKRFFYFCHVFLRFSTFFYFFFWNVFKSILFATLTGCCEHYSILFRIFYADNGQQWQYWCCSCYYPG